MLAIGLLCKLTYKVKVVKSDSDADWEYDIRIRWLFGFIKRSVKSTDVKKEIIKDKSEKEEVLGIVAKPDIGYLPDGKKKRKARNKKENKGKKRLDILKSLGIEGSIRIIGYTIGLLKKIFETFRTKRIMVRGIYGAKSPDVTGKVIAAIYTAAAALSVRADVEGDFENEVLQLDIRAMGYFRLWAVFIPMVRYIFRPEIWRLIFPGGLKRKKRGKKKVEKNNLEVDGNGHRI